MGGALIFVTRSRCGLCDEALRLLGPRAANAGVAVAIRDVDDDSALFDAFDMRVPVIIDATTGKVLAEGSIDASVVGGVMRAVAD